MKLEKRSCKFQCSEIKTGVIYIKIYIFCFKLRLFYAEKYQSYRCFGQTFEKYLC